MPSKTDPRVDAYIADSPDFAKPILEAVRAAAHGASDKVTETIKWGVPFFEYKGSICGVSSHKEHCNLVVLKGELIPDLQKWISEATEEGPGVVGRITTEDQLPEHNRFVAILKAAVDLNERGIKAPKAPPKPAPEEASMPDYLHAVIQGSDAVRRGWAGLSPSKQREYIAWLEDAKTEATRQKRLDQAAEWIADGKGRHWKYER